MEFMETYVKTNNRKSEQASKRCVLNRYLLPRFGKRRLDEIGLRDVEGLKADLVGLALAQSTVNNVLAVLSKILKYAAEVEVLATVPKFKFIKLDPRRYHFLDFEEFDHLIRVTQKRDPQLSVALLLAGAAGLRRGELAALRWQDVNLDLNKLTIDRAYYLHGLQHDVVAPKGGHMRQVPLTQRLASALRAHRHLKDKHVLVRAKGGTWTCETFLWQGDRAYRLASLPRPAMPWHALRHTFCSHLAMRGASPKAIQELAGHRHIETTMKYMHLAPVALTEAISLLDTGSSGTVAAQGGYPIPPPLQKQGVW